MSIEPKGLWEHSAYQTDNRFIVEIKPILEDPTKLIQGSRVGYTGEKLSLNFQNVEVRAVLQVIADFTGLNFITSDTVGGNLTLRLKDVPWDQALDIILQTKGLDMRKNGNVVWIAPRDELATKEKLRSKRRRRSPTSSRCAPRSFQLNYQKARRVPEDPCRQGPAHPVQARQRGRRSAHQHVVRAGHAVATRAGARADAQDRRARAPGHDRSADRRGLRHVHPQSRCAPGHVRPRDRDRPAGNTVLNSDNRVTAGGSLDATGFSTAQIATPIPTFAQTPRREPAGDRHQRPQPRCVLADIV